MIAERYCRIDVVLVAGINLLFAGSVDAPRDAFGFDGIGTAGQVFKNEFPLVIGGGAWAGVRSKLLPRLPDCRRATPTVPWKRDRRRPSRLLARRRRRRLDDGHLDCVEIKIARLVSTRTSTQQSPVSLVGSEAEAERSRVETVFGSPLNCFGAP